jgi:hypothetical protein
VVESVMRAAVLLGVLVSLLLGGLILPATARAADVTFEKPVLTATIRDLDASVAFTSSETPVRAELMTRLRMQESWSVLNATVTGGNGRYTATVESTRRRLPNTPLVYRFRVTTKSGVSLSDEGELTVVDGRFTWQRLEGRFVRLHWYRGGDDFGRRALAVADKAITDTTKLLGVTETEPIDFFVYSSTDAYREALGPGTPENSAGQANPTIRTLFALIEPGQINSSWVPVVITHELTHLVFNTATTNPYHSPPRWLNEGLAVYRSEGNGAGSRARLANAKTRNELIPLEGLAIQFPPGDKFFLSYAESVSAVDFFIRKYGQPTLVKLVRSYAAGVSDDDAFKAATGADAKAFNLAWLRDLGAKMPDATGPRPVLPGPLPADWTGAAPTPATTGQPAPSRVSPGATAASPAPPMAPTEPTSDQAVPALAVGLLLLVLGIAIGGSVLLTRRRPRPSGPPPPADPG